ncbi:hypothetical protein KBB96_08895 [Luteolibacter ambystomatis]|uniref:Uncharacterized protein n=1 Tax=Luteolibacter ambystomatis TaxID=2824561 RepID=A0A975J2U6_9BACT|nr:hypothetical protein [Luteolibacter ambystomatis]QUE52994.1 hypothetical protein KBB96_08895 [Luteolibacter ambystomatis]
MKYRVLVEATRRISSGKLILGLGPEPSVDNLDWVGCAYVLAENAEEAGRKFGNFFTEHAQSWVFDGDPEPIDAIEEFELDYLVIEERGDVPKFENGEVVAGWGM